MASSAHRSLQGVSGFDTGVLPKAATNGAQRDAVVDDLPGFSRKFFNSSSPIKSALFQGTAVAANQYAHIYDRIAGVSSHIRGSGLGIPVGKLPSACCTRCAAGSEGPSWILTTVGSFGV